MVRKVLLACSAAVAVFSVQAQATEAKKQDAKVEKAEADRRPSSISSCGRDNITSLNAVDLPTEISRCGGPWEAEGTGASTAWFCCINASRGGGGGGGGR